MKNQNRIDNLVKGAIDTLSQNKIYDADIKFAIKILKMALKEAKKEEEIT